MKNTSANNINFCMDFGDIGIIVVIFYVFTCKVLYKIFVLTNNQVILK